MVHSLTSIGSLMLAVLLATFLLILGGCVIANRFYVPPAFEPAVLTNIVPGMPTAGDVITLTTWNLGYGGMGRESDFVYDLGKQRRPLKAELVDKNIKGILTHLAGMDSDLFLFQEAARPSWVNYRRDLMASLEQALPEYALMFGADVNTRGLPPPWNIKVGNAIFTRLLPLSAERRGLPLEPQFELGLFRRGYRMHIIRLQDGRQWTIINIHLSTFDTAEDDVRRKQVIQLLDFAQQEFALGHFIVIGGDWNLRLAQNNFANTTQEKFKFWIRDFPTDLLPVGWQFAVDPSVPTVRTAYQPYVAGENYVLNIDGFLVSPNVAVRLVQGTNFGFENSDHNPVKVTLAMLPPPA